jgi:hypothetical protein
VANKDIDRACGTHRIDGQGMWHTQDIWTGHVAHTKVMDRACGLHRKYGQGMWHT